MTFGPRVVVADLALTLACALGGAAGAWVLRRRTSLPHLRGESLDDLATQSANDALVAVLAKRMESTVHRILLNARVVAMQDGPKGVTVSIEGPVRGIALTGVRQGDVACKLNRRGWGAPRRIGD